MEKKERTITRVSDGKQTAKQTTKKAVETVEQEAQEVTKAKRVESLTAAEEKSKATTLRIVAFILWAVAIACEIIAILLINEKIKLPFFSTRDDVRIALWIPLAIFIVIDAVCCIIASSLWKKSNRLAPFRKTNNKVGFFILTQLGAIMALVCFMPLIIFLLTNKKLDKKTKTIFTIVAAVALVIVALLGIDWNPISKEEKDAAANTITDDVFWSQYGRKYHIYEDCQTIRNSDLTAGKVQDAIDNGRESLCAFCAKRAGIDNPDMKIEQRSDVPDMPVEELPEETTQDLPVVNDGEGN